MTNPFSTLSTQDLEAPKDYLGGFGALDSGVYSGTIKAAYAGKSTHGAFNMNFVVELDVNGAKREYRETVYVTNRNGENFYTKDGKKNPLPGFVTANDIALLTTGQELNAQTFEEKVVKVYDYDAKQELPQKVQMATDLVGKPITLAILKQIEDKNVKDASGNYVPSGDTREVNVIDKVFHAESGRTVSEVTRKMEAGEFITQWSDKNTGTVRNKAKGATGTPGRPGAPAAAGTPAAPAKSGLFG